MTALVIIILFRAITLFVKEQGKSDASDAQANTFLHVCK